MWFPYQHGLWIWSHILLSFIFILQTSVADEHKRVSRLTERIGIYMVTWQCEVVHANNALFNPERLKCRCIGVHLFPFKNYHKLPGCCKCHLLLCFSSFLLFLLYIWMEIVEDTTRKAVDSVPRGLKSHNSDVNHPRAKYWYFGTPLNHYNAYIFSYITNNTFIEVPTCLV